VKAAYRKELKEFNFNNDARLMDKINFIRAYNKARTAGLTKKNIQSAFRTTGNWLINRIKALSHPEIQPNDNPKTPERELASESKDYLKHTPKNSRQIRDFGKKKSPSTRYFFGKAAKAYTNLEFEIIALKNKVAAAKAENERSTRARKRKVIPNPNQKFMHLSEAIASNERILENQNAIADPNVEIKDFEEIIEDEIVVGNAANAEKIETPAHRTRSGRAIKRPRWK
jgi:hypothetical protein